MEQTFKVLKGNYFQPKMLYPTESLIKCEGRTNTFSNLKILKNNNKNIFSRVLFQKINRAYLPLKWKRKPRKGKADPKSHMGSVQRERQRGSPGWWGQAAWARSTRETMGDVFAKMMKLIEYLISLNELREIFTWQRIKIS